MANAAEGISHRLNLGCAIMRSLSNREAMIIVQTPRFEMSAIELLRAVCSNDALF